MIPVFVGMCGANARARSSSSSVRGYLPPERARLIDRPSPGIDDLRPSEYIGGWRTLDRKIARYRPEVVAFIGVTLFRAIFPLIADTNGQRPVVGRIALGKQAMSIHGAEVFVLPNPSGRNDNFSYAEMLAAFKRLRRHLNRSTT